VAVELEQVLVVLVVADRMAVQRRPEQERCIVAVRRQLGLELERCSLAVQPELGLELERCSLAVRPELELEPERCSLAVRPELELELERCSLAVQPELGLELGRCSLAVQPELGLELEPGKIEQEQLEPGQVADSLEFPQRLEVLEPGKIEQGRLVAKPQAEVVGSSVVVEVAQLEPAAELEAVGKEVMEAEQAACLAIARFAPSRSRQLPPIRR